MSGSDMFRAILIGALLASTPINAQDLRALARVDMGRSYVRDDGNQVEMRLALTQAVPFRTTFFKDPMRLYVDFREVVFDPAVSQLDQSDYIADVRAGPIPKGWSRLVLELAAPMGLDLAHMTTDPSTGQAVIDLRLAPISDEDFASLALDNPDVAEVKAAPDALPLIMIDPGHGGVDPGAERGGVKEADLMLQFARELRENLRRTGRFRVAMTRDGDDFVSLPERVSMARRARASAFVSLHADALAEGRATGTTIYTLSDEASDQASAKLAERQNRKDLLAGVDLTAVDDQVALALMDLARERTSPRTDRLADALVLELKQSLGKLHKRPRLKAGFSVLKAPDIPSVLVELGFMSSQSDLDRLQDPVWRAEASNGIIAGLDRWLAEEAVLNSSQ